MEKMSRRVSTVALAAVLLFMACVPVPVGASAFDRLRFERAEAVAPAVVAAPLAAALVAGGVIIGGATLTDYNANLQSVYDGLANGSEYWSSSWAAYCEDKGGFDMAIQSAMTVDGQNISLQTLSDNGFYDSVKNYTAYCLDNGSMVNGASSLDSMGNVIVLGSVEYRTFGGISPAVMQYSTHPSSNSVLFAYQGFPAYSYGNVIGTRYELYWSQSDTVRVSSANANRISLNDSQWMESITIRASDGVKSDGYTNSSVTNINNYAQTETLLSSEVNYVYNGAAAETSQIQQYGAVVAGAVADAIAGNEYAWPTETVQPFEPTAEQLEAGYTEADVVAAINAGNASLDGIAAGIGAVQGLLAPMAGIATGVQSLVNDWASFLSTPISWLQSWWNTLTGWWQQLLAWIGATPFGTVMGTVIDGVQAIPGAVSGAADAVVSGVQAIPGMLEGVLEGILEGVQSIPVSISEVIDAIQAGVLDLTGALDVALEPPQVPNSGEGLRLRDELRAQLDTMLDMKAPFCYMRSMQALAAGIAGNFGGDPTFYFDLDIPFAGTQRFDAGPLLNQAWGSRSVADYIRIMLTASMCAGLLAVSLKIAIGRIGRKED